MDIILLDRDYDEDIKVNYMLIVLKERLNFVCGWKRDSDSY